MYGSALQEFSNQLYIYCATMNQYHLLRGPAVGHKRSRASDLGMYCHVSSWCENVVLNNYWSRVLATKINAM